MSVSHNKVKGKGISIESRGAEKTLCGDTKLTGPAARFQGHRKIWGIWSFARGGQGLLALALLAVLSIAGAQPTNAKGDARPDALVLQVHELQRELEALQRENTRLQEQLAQGTEGNPQAAAQPHQHAEQAGAQGAARTSRPQAELSELQQQFELLGAQQGNLIAQLQAIGAQHAALFEQLGSGAPGAQPQTYVVRPGDTLSRLAQSFYGSASRWTELLAANPFLTDPNRLLTGTVLTIP